MRAEEALAGAPQGLIVADTPRGFVAIHCEAGAGSVAACAFHVRFVPRDLGGQLDAAGTVEVGSYDDLDTALTIAALGYGAGEAGWSPVGDDTLVPGAVAGPAAEVEGRRVMSRVEAEDGGAEGDQKG